MFLQSTHKPVVTPLVTTSSWTVHRVHSTIVIVIRKTQNRLYKWFLKGVVGSRTKLNKKELKSFVSDALSLFLMIDLYTGTVRSSFCVCRKTRQRLVECSHHTGVFVIGESISSFLVHISSWTLMKYGYGLLVDTIN